ncbi:PfkB family carbohydrate kinase [Streptomyces sp. NBC_01283]|uniref:PfkB family carbohydrate kinase n=1 Tax=Streptomyces sp. NBC_01283 TaxID=2903812 RepID=UPI00352D4844|nr:PfkB family carbohydrate kinase [Streptomyces sp. NBC_01283]
MSVAATKGIAKRIAVSGVIAMDHLMTFPGRFPERPAADRPHVASLAFLAERLGIRRGGAAANIAFGLGRLGLDPVLVGAVGSDFADYQVWLKQHGVDTESVLVVPGEHTARHVCTTDTEGERFSTFRPGAMGASSALSLRSVAGRTGGLGLVVVAPGDPAAMLRHTEECRALGLPFVAHPSWQIGGMGRADLKYLISGASCVVTDEGDAARLREATGWSGPRILERVGAWVTTLGAAGVRIERAGHTPSLVPGIGSVAVAEPSGAGDALRAGLIAGVAQGAPIERAAQLGCVLASFALEATGAQEYAMDVRRLLNRAREAYGHTTAAAIRRLLTYAA